MQAMILPRIVSLAETDRPLEQIDRPVPAPAAGQIRIRVAACGVCHTELDEIEGRTPPRRLPVVPGHEVVGYVDQLGRGVTRWRVGDRVGVGWIHHSTGAEDENLSAAFVATGRDVDGGYAEYMLAAPDYAFAIPDVFTDVEAAPLLCAGAIGYRALRLTGIRDGDSLGLTGFGGSAHLVLQVTRSMFPRSRVYVFARDPAQRQFALQLGAEWTGGTEARSPEPLRAIIDTTPAWHPVVQALANLAPGGRLVINAISKQRDDQQRLLELDYQRHLWQEKEVKTVANITRRDIAEFLPIAASGRVRPATERYVLGDANRALVDLKRGAVRGAKVLVM